MGRVDIDESCLHRFSSPPRSCALSAGRNLEELGTCEREQSCFARRRVRSDAGAPRRPMVLVVLPKHKGKLDTICLPGRLPDSRPSVFATFAPIAIMAVMMMCNGSGGGCDSNNDDVDNFDKSRGALVLDSAAKSTSVPSRSERWQCGGRSLRIAAWLANRHLSPGDAAPFVEQ